jgi:hypothetical protein
MDSDFLSNFLSFDGVSRRNGNWILQGTFRPVALVATILSALVLTVFNGAVSIIRGAFAVVIRPLRGLQSFVAELIVAAVGPNGLFATAVSATQSQLIASGVLGFGLAAVVTAASFYAVSYGVSLLE